MTDEEHTTRAMLLGLKWDKGMRLYYSGVNTTQSSIDQDTLCAISEDEWWTRLWDIPAVQL